MKLLDTILNAIRKPNATPALTVTQTDIRPGEGGQRAMVGYLHRELAEHPSKGLTPARLYEILQEAESGSLAHMHALFADMEEKDAQIGSDMGKRRNTLAGMEWQIVAPDGASRVEKKAVAHAQEVFAALDVDDLVLDLTDGIGHGWVNLELPWQRDGLTRSVMQPIWRPHGWFMIDTQTNQNELRLRDGSVTGEGLWPLGWVRHIHKAKSGYVTRLGLHRMLVWPYLFQNYALGDLAELLEILGIPARLGRYPNGASEEEKATLLRAVMSLGHRAAGIIPDGMQIEYLEAAKTTADAYQIMLQWCDTVKTRAILGGTLTTGNGSGGVAGVGAGSGSYALGQVHERGLAALLKSDATQVSATIRRDILLPMAALNYGITSRERCPRFYIDMGETEDFKTLSDSLPIFVDMGAQIPRWWLHEKTGIPQAAEGEEILERAPATAPAAPQAPAQSAQTDSAAPLTARLATAQDQPDAVDRQVERLSRQAGPLVSAMLSTVRKELAKAKDLPAFQVRLLELYPELKTADLTELLASAFAATELTGRYEAQQGAKV